jgi:hypothetical protein
MQGEWAMPPDVSRNNQIPPMVTNGERNRGGQNYSQEGTRMDDFIYQILHQERRGQVKTIVMEHFNGILFHKSRPANKQHTNQSIKLSLH